MGGVRRQARAVPDREDRRGAAGVPGGWCQVAQAAVMVRVVVPREQIAADVARVGERAEPARKLRPVLHGPELRFGERIVVAHAGPRMTGVDAQIREEQRDELAPHGRAAVRMNRELVRGEALLQAGRRNQALRQVRILVARDHPAHPEQIEVNEKTRSDSAADLAAANPPGDYPGDTSAAPEPTASNVVSAVAFLIPADEIEVEPLSVPAPIDEDTAEALASLGLESAAPNTTKWTQEDEDTDDRLTIALDEVHAEVVARQLVEQEQDRLREDTRRQVERLEQELADAYERLQTEAVLRRAAEVELERLREENSSRVAEAEARLALTADVALASEEPAVSQRAAATKKVTATNRVSATKKATATKRVSATKKATATKRVSATKKAAATKRATATKRARKPAAPRRGKS